MSRVREWVRAYHLKFHPDQQETSPTTMSPEMWAFRRRLDDEETQEVVEAWDTVEEAGPLSMPIAVAHLLHELADRTIVAYGTASFLGVDLEDVIRVVLDAGMAKTRNPDPNGKALKPAGFVPADERVRELVARVERERQAVVRSGLSFVGGDWTTAADYDAYQRERYGPGGTIT